MPRNSLLALALIVTASPVLASCPTAADLSQGIYVVYDDASYTAFTALANGDIRIEEVSPDNGGVVYRFDTRYGLFTYAQSDLREGELLPGSQITTTYAGGLDAVPKPLAGLEWQGNSENTYAGGDTAAEITRVTVSLPRELVLGGCPVTLLDVTRSHEVDQEVDVWEEAYIPALGIALTLSTQYHGEEKDTYTPVALTSVRP